MTNGEQEKKEQQEFDPQALKEMMKQLKDKPPEEVARLLLQSQEQVSNLDYENQDLRERNQQLADQAETLNKEVKELKIDEVSGLEQRGDYYRNVESQLDKVFADPDMLEILEKERLTPDDIEKLKQVRLSVVFGDLGYLAKYNGDKDMRDQINANVEKASEILGRQIGDYGRRKFYAKHDVGDIMIRATGDTMKDIRTPDKTKSFRYSKGDEFTMVVNLPYDRTLSEEKDEDGERKVILEGAVDVVDDLVVNHGKIEIPFSDLPPAFNCKIAHVSEAIIAFRELHRGENITEIDPEERNNEIAHLMTQIADYRAEKGKRISRIYQLIDLYNNKPKVFEKNHKFLAKGAGDIPIEVKGEEEASFQLVSVKDLAQLDKEGKKDDLARAVEAIVGNLAEKDKEKEVEKLNIVEQIANRTPEGNLASLRPE